MQTVVPTKGAVVLAEFQTRIGARALLSLRHKGRPVPFGATAIVSYQGATVSTGIVSANGEVYLSGIPAKGRLHAIWGNESSQQCLADINMPPAGNTTSSTVLSLNVLCD
ncbi:FimD/PapC C-terminal domain-containing protein [Serratia sp. L9]|uniref:FimD/PapC C-terminal domain-containing protein n=1 Tax=Serratia sp. L9 TaxID=3423946 RepID=UPI003D676789